MEPFTYIFEPRVNESMLFNIACNNELFPQPTSPMIQMNSPFFISKLIFFKMGSRGFIFFLPFFSSGFSKEFIPKPPSKSILSIFSINLSLLFDFFEDVLIVELSVDISSLNS